MVMLMLISLKSFSKTISPSPAFGNAIDVQVYENGNTKGIRAINARGEIFDGVYRVENNKAYYLHSQYKNFNIFNEANVVSQQTVKGQ